MNMGWGILTVVSEIKNNDEQQHCQHCCSLFGCHVTNCDVAPVFHMNEMKGEEGWVDSPGLVTACVHSWVQAIVCGVGVGCRLWVAIFVFWLVMVALQLLVVVMSMVGGGGKEGWWWEKESGCVW